MPIYEYECDVCGKKFEMFRSISAGDDDICCPYCGEKKVTKVFSAFGVSGLSSGGGCTPDASGGST
jgi:putative FmdB family regulatory protein